MPPITSTSPNLPETPDEISVELQKQDSLLNQIHAEMNAGFVTKKREEQLWEVQRIITQLKVCYFEYLKIKMLCCAVRTILFLFPSKVFLILRDCVFFLGSMT